MSEFEKIVLFASPIISLLGLLIGWRRWKEGEQSVVASNAANNFTDVANKQADFNQRLQKRIDELEQDKEALQDEKDALQKQLEDGGKLLSDLRVEREQWIQERKNWQDRNISLAKRVGILSKNYEGVERELARIRKWGYANVAEVERLGGVPIRLEDVKG
jgi:chromosome segregation ATPase